MNERQNVGTNDATKKLSETAISMNPVGAIFRESSSKLASKIVNLFVDTYGIKETDHVCMYPVKDKSGRIKDFEMVMYFNVRGNQAGKANIWRVSKNGKAQSDDSGRINFAPMLGAKLTNGGFQISDEFRKIFSVIAYLDENNRIMIDAIDGHPDIACVRLYFFDVIAICLGIGSNDPVNPTIVDCVPDRNNDSPNEYIITLGKIISGDGKSRRRGVNYDNIDSNIIRRHGTC